MPAANLDLIIRGKTNLSQAQAQLNALYRTGTRGAKRMTTQIQKFGHHNLAALAIFKGLAVYRGFGAITQQLADGVQRAIEFEKAMANVNSLLQVGQWQLNNYKDYLADLSTQIPLTMGQLAEGMYDVVSAGILAEDQIKEVTTLAGKAAVAGVTDLKNAVQAGIGTMNAFGKSVDDLDHIYDVHFMTVKMGILTYEQLNQVLGRVTATASLAGQGMETATSALVAMSRGGFGGAAFEEGSTRVVRFFQELSDTAAQQKIQQLGIQVYDSFGRMRNAIDIVSDLQGELAEMTEEARQATINQIFTNIRSAQGFAVLSQQVDIWREAQMASIFSAGAMESALEKQLNAISNIFTEMQNKFTNAMREIVALMRPIITGFSDFMDVFGRNWMNFSIIIGIVAAKFTMLNVAAKAQMRQEELRMAQLQMKEVMAQKEVAMEQQKINLRNQAIHVTTFQTNQEAYANVIRQQTVLATDIETLKLKELIQTRQLAALEAQKEYNLKQHNIQKQKEAIITTQQLIQAKKHEQMALQKEVVGLSSRYKMAYKNVITDQQRVAQTRDNINAYNMEINVLEQDIYMLQFRKIQMLGNISAMIGMTTGMAMMTMAAQSGNKWLKTLGAAITGVTLGIQTYTSLLPLFISLMTAKTGAINAQTTSYWGLVTAEGAATGGLSAALAAAGVAAAIGVVTYATMELATVTNETSDEMDDFGDSMLSVGEIAGTTDQKIADFVRDLVRQGETIASITAKVREATGTFETFNENAAAGLIRGGYANVNGMGLMQPTAIAQEFFPETVSGDFKAGLQSLLFTTDEMSRILAGDATLMVEIQNRLLAIEDETIRNVTTQMVFGEQFGASMISLWDTAGQKMVVAGEETEEAMTYAENRMSQILNDIENISPQFADLLGLDAKQKVITLELGSGLEEGGQWWTDIQNAMDELGINFMERTMGKDIFGREAFPRITMSKEDAELLQEYLYVHRDIMNPSGASSAIREGIRTGIETPLANLAEKLGIPKELVNQYADLVELTGTLVTFTEMSAGNIAELTQAQQNALDALAAIDLSKAIGNFDISKLNTMVEGVLSNTEALDAAGLHFGDTAGNWDMLGRKWERIQTQWEAIDMARALLDFSSGIRELSIPGFDSTTLVNAVNRALVGMEPMLLQMIAPLAGNLEYVFGEMGENFSSATFWQNILEVDETSDAVVKTIEEGMMEMVDAVTGISQLDDFITDLVDAGSTLDDAGFYFHGVAGNWDQLGEDWKKIQKMWMGLEIMQTLMSVVSDMSGAAQTMVQVGEHTERQYVGEEQRYTDKALEAQSIMNSQEYKSIKARMAQMIEDFGSYENIPGIYRGWYYAMNEWTKTIERVSQQMESVPIYEDITVPDYESILGGNQAGAIEDMRQALVEALLPILQTMTGNAAGGLIEILQGMLGNLGDPDFWDTLFEESQEEVVKTIEEMAQEYLDIARDALSVGDAFEAFADYGESLEAAGFYFKNVAGNWAVVGEEWARIQSYFQVQQMINSFIQSANAMKEYGLVLPEQFQQTMYTLMQTMATHVIPDFQGMMDELMDDLGSEDFWSALAEGMAKADIRQSNAITIAPYIVIEGADDDEAIINKIHDALVAEAKKAGFNWG